MTRSILVLALLFSFSLSFSQKKAIDFYKIKSYPEVRQYITANPTSEMFWINSGCDTSEIDLPLYRKKAGFVFNFGNTYFRILKVDSTLSFGVSFMFINVEKYSKLQIDSIRKVIIEQYKAGASFSNLMQQHILDGSIVKNRSVDDNPRWLTHNTMMPEFEKEVRTHKKNDIFTIDMQNSEGIPRQNWYFVALRTFEDTFIKTVYLLKATIIKPSGGQ